MSVWLNNKKQIWKKTVKPCRMCGFCPYGQLVEAFPLHTKEEKYAIKHNRYSKLIKGKGWTKCKKTDKGASPDINWSSGKVKNKISCDVFGHDCPAFYMAEPLGEDKEATAKELDTCWEEWKVKFFKEKKR